MGREPQPSLLSDIQKRIVESLIWHKPQRLTSNNDQYSRIMRPESFTQSGFVVLIIGFILFAAGAGLLAQQILCNISFNSCGSSSVENAIRSVTMLLLLVFGVPLIVVGAIFTAIGHMTQHLRPIERDEDPIPAQLIRVCVKCGRQVDPSAGFCPSCGNQLAK